MADGLLAPMVKLGAQNPGVTAFGQPGGGKCEQQVPVGAGVAGQWQVGGRAQAGQQRLQLGGSNGRLRGEKVVRHRLASAVAHFVEQGQGFRARAAGRLPKQGAGLATGGFGQGGKGADNGQLGQCRGAA